MSDVISLTAAMRSNLLSLQKTDSQIGVLQNRLATGKKVNSALDDPTAFFAAQGLSNRASDLTALIDSMGQAVQTLKAVDQTITSMSKMLASAKAIAQTALTKTSANAVVTGDISLDAAAMADVVAETGVNTADEINITVAGGTQVDIVITTGDTIQDIMNAINSDLGLQSGGVQQVKAELVADPDVNGNFFLQISTTGGETLEIAGAGATALGIATTGAVGAAADTAAEVEQYNEIRTQLESMITDGGYRGKNLLAGDDLRVQFNEKNDSFINISGVERDLSATGLNVSEADFASTGSIEAAIAQIDAALETLRNDSSSFGNRLAIIQNREDFTKELINTLVEGSDKLTLADKNEEGAKLLALQTSQALGIQALALASQSNQSVLRLFQ